MEKTMTERARNANWAEKIWSGELNPDENATEQNLDAVSSTAIVQRFFLEVWNRGNLNVVDELLAPDFVDHNPAPGTPGDPNAYKATVNIFRSAFPDFTFTTDQILSEGDRVALRLTGRGTQRGVFMSLPPTNKVVSFGSMIFVRFRDGRICDQWGIFNIPGLLQQIGSARE
jgi:steroid delta-isomerase-like uncharacterized protein